MMEFVYIAANEAMPGLLKIGRTCDLARRLAELSAGTSVPLPFRLVDAVATPAAAALEQRMHWLFADCRASGNREFFRLEAPVAIAALRSMAPGAMGEVIDVSPRRGGFWAGYDRWSTEAPFAQIVLALFLVLFSPVVIIIGGLALAGIWDAIVGR